MNKNSKVIVTIVSGLLGILLMLPILTRGMGNMMFWVLLGVLAILTTMLVFSVTDRRQQR